MNVIKVLSIILFDYFFAATSPVVEVKNGSLQGTVMESRNGREFFAYRGIPYARPPVGHLRFEPPVPAESWRGVKSARYDGATCSQKYGSAESVEIIGSEDCLYLNVYTPRLPSSRRINSPMPVMVWFHGGGYDTGTSHSLIYGPKFILDHDVVLVAVNYRLGAMGFLSTEDSVVYGNQGLKDQAQSIRWVHENIAVFGGDPSRVTLFGQSAGAASANFHMMSSLSRGLFHRVIGQSGAVRCPWAYNRPGLSRKYAKRLGEFLNCPTKNSTALVSCLRMKDVNEIISTDQQFQHDGYLYLTPFKPTVEIDHPGAFLVKEPVEFLDTGKWDDIPWLTGITSHEGGYAVAVNEGMYDNFFQVLDENWMKMAPKSLMYEEICPPEYQPEVSRKVREFYLGNKAIDRSTKFDVINMISDGVGTAIIDKSVRDHFEKKKSPVYYYHFAYNGTTSMGRRLGQPSTDYGVIHGDELQYLFPLGENFFSDTPLTDTDNKMIDILTTLWYNFANTGNPTPNITSRIPVKWTPVQSDELEYLLIENPDSLIMSKNLYPERIKFWQSLPQLGWTFASTATSNARTEL